MPDLLGCSSTHKSFIDRILIKTREELIIGELVAMCHKLGLQVIAEGVEKEKQRQYLREQGCEYDAGVPIQPFAASGFSFT